MGTQDKENGRSLFSRFKLNKSPPKTASPSPPPSRTSSQDARAAPSRLPAAPPQPARGPAAAPAGGGSQLQLRPQQAAASTPRNFARAPQSARGPAPQPAPAARRPAADGSLSARRVPKLGAPPMTPTVSPGCSYKEALTTPRMAAASKLPGPPLSAAGTPRQAAAALAPSPLQQCGTAGGGGHQQQHQRCQEQHQQQELAERQQHSLLLVQQQARASHEHEHMQQQISRLEASMAAKQAELAGHLAALAVLGERREALAEHLSSIQQLLGQAKAAEEARRAEVSELELAVKAVQAVAETHKLQAAAGEQKAAAARASLLGIMQAVAQTLRLPALASSIQQELSSGGGGGGSSDESAAQAAAAAAAPQQAGQVVGQGPAPAQQAQQQPQQQPQQQARRPVCPKSPSEAGSQCYATPPGSIAGGEESASDGEDEYQDGSSSSESESGSECGSPRGASPQPTSSSGSAGEITARRDSLTGGSVGEAAQRQGPVLPQLRLGGIGQQAAAADGPHGSARGPPASRIPGVSLVSPQPPAAAKPQAAAATAAAAGAGGAVPSGRVSPQVLLRLQSISSKLEAALADQALLDVDAA